MKCTAGIVSLCFALSCRRLGKGILGPNCATNFFNNEFDAVPMLDAVLNSRDSLSPPKQPALGVRTEVINCAGFWPTFAAWPFAHALMNGS